MAASSLLDPRRRSLRRPLALGAPSRCTSTVIRQILAPGLPRTVEPPRTPPFTAPLRNPRKSPLFSTPRAATGWKSSTSPCSVPTLNPSSCTLRERSSAHDGPHDYDDRPDRFSFAAARPGSFHPDVCSSHCLLHDLWFCLRQHARLLNTARERPRGR